MASRDTLTVLAEQFALAFQRLGAALDTAEGQRGLLRELGWDFATPPAGLGNLVSPVAAVTAFADVDQVDEGQIPQLLAAVAGAFGAIAALGSDASLSPDLQAALPTQLADYVVVRYFFEQQPRWGYLLYLLGLISVDEVPAAGTRLAYVSFSFAYSQIGSLLTDPLTFLKNTYQWGQSGFRGDLLLGGLEGWLDAWDMQARRGAIGGPLLAQLQTGALSPADASDAPLWLILIRDQRDPASLNLGAGLYVLPETATAKPGFAVLPVASAQFDQELDLNDNLTLTLEAQVDLSSGVGLFVRPNQDVSFTAGLAGGAPAPVTGSLALQLQLQPGDPIVIIGSADASRLQLGGVSTTAGIRLDGKGGQEVFAEFATAGGKVIINPASGDADGFLASLIPADGLTAPFDLRVGFSTTRGLYFGASGGFEVTIPTQLQVGPVDLQSVTIAVRVSDGGIPIEISAAFSADLSVLKATADGVGLTADLTFPGDRKGNLGPADLQLKFKPPTGLGIAVDAGPVSGGGFISFDPTNGRYFGALELSVYSVAVKAFGIIETKFPDGHTGFSFLIIISAEFVPIQLGLGFTLLGVGGMAGINRSIDTDGLLAAVRKGDLENVLFPHDVVDDAPAILHDLETIFPPADGHDVFGPMAKIGWGTPTLVDAELGLIIELPGPVLAVIGTVHAAIPTADAALVELNLDVAGVLDFPKKFFSLDASLHDSRVADFPVSGDMAMRLYWGQNPSFAIAIGGFNKHYNPPAGFPTLKRVSIDLGVHGNPSINVSGYLALTSNTFQTGAQLEARVSAAGAELYGFLGFDAIFVFSPFSFEADIEGGVGVKFHGVGFSLQFHGTISGPSPWHVDGQVCVSILFWDACVGLSISLGGESKPTLPGLDPWLGSDIKPDGTQDVPGLQPALQNPANWGGSPVTGSFAVVTLVPAAANSSPPVDPLGSATVRQKAVPLDLAITKFAGTKPSVNRTFDVQSVTIGQSGQAGFTTVSEPARVSDFFAPAQYQNMKDADKLSSPSFVQLAAGFTISSDAVTVGTSAAVGLTYDTIVFGPGDTETLYPQQFNPSQAHVTSVTARSAVTLGGIRNAAQARFVDPTAAPKVTLLNELYVISQIASLKVAAGFSLTTAVPRPVATAALLAAAAVSATALQTLQVTSVWSARA